MSEESYSFDMARVRLEEIAAQVRKKDISLEKSLDLLEEGVRLANMCTEQIDQTQWRSMVEVTAETEAPEAAAADAGDASCEEEAAGAGAVEAGGDIPTEDSHASAEEAPLEDPDVEA